MPLPQAFHDVSAKVRNWGRWGDDDQLGTLNFITDEVVAGAASCIRTGKRFSLAIDLHLHGPQMGAVPGRVNPLKTMIAIDAAPLGDPDGFHTSDDVVTMGLQAGTHWDGLTHVSYGGQLYNGNDVSTLSTNGASVCGIENVKTLVGRGVLLDIAKLRGVDIMAGGDVITGEDLDAAAADAGIEIRAGDIICIRTGLIQHYFDGDPATFNAAAGNPGPGLSAVEWFHDHSVAAVADDTYVFEVFPSEHPDAMLAVHMLDVVDMGLTQGQLWNFQELAADCAADGVYEFFLDASPLPFVGGCGSPVNPVAIK